METVLVTGGAGFLGSHLSEKLLGEGSEVVCVDNLITGSQKNIAHLLNDKNFTFINHDVIKPFSNRKFKFNKIYHLASPADPNSNSPFSYLAHPFETMLVNTTGTWNMCELAARHGAKLSFASTSEVYGDPERSPQGEDYRGNVSTIGPRSVYDEAKRFGETIVSAFVRKKGLDGRITRIFNTYGPRMNPSEGRAVVNFINQALSGERITIYGDGKQTRSFCYVDDQIEGQIAAMEEGSSGEIYNLGNDDEKTILQFAQMIKALTNSSSEIIFSEPLPEDDPLIRKPNTNKAKRDLGWQPKIPLEEGLQKTIEYFRSTS
ncbi:MAG: SDR family oxidoreductase [Candidatus Curtissbacteria bacterium]|nr:SDR family oxidoreductase [Candidatus Curtissbacteria bacterium]